MAERGALSLLSLLCLTFLYTETTAAKHVDKVHKALRFVDLLTRCCPSKHTYLRCMQNHNVNGLIPFFTVSNFHASAVSRDV
ncbi:hypothetical protein D9C73_003618 [Collichthys lucidus]|uniref:Secreted protein n=1 Tax=Collichthys lucidus TaxID=240159 RepID=A0A4U5U5N1_COLLU|nr:hypothetical protein D9C73_003618 [Collichthys lucidus]